jgi:hypothetical protein
MTNQNYDNKKAALPCFGFSFATEGVHEVANHKSPQIGSRGKCRMEKGNAECEME